MLWIFIIGLIMGLFWYGPIEALIEVLSTKTMEEYDIVSAQIKSEMIKNKIMLAIAFILRTPIILPIFILLFIHFTKLYIRESK